MQPHKLKNNRTGLKTKPLHGPSVLRSLIFPPHRLFHEHIQRLSKVVTANHRALQIPEVVIYFLNKWKKNEHLFSCSLVNDPPPPLPPTVCRCTWRRPPGPLLSLRSRPLMRTRPLETRSSASCACVPPSWTSLVWPTKTLSQERTTLSLCLSLFSSA